MDRRGGKEVERIQRERPPPPPQIRKPDQGEKVSGSLLGIRGNGNQRSGGSGFSAGGGANEKSTPGAGGHHQQCDRRPAGTGQAAEYQSGVHDGGSKEEREPPHHDG